MVFVVGSLHQRSDMRGCNSRISLRGDMTPGYYLSLVALLSLASLFTIRKLGATA
jgi:hypothetical protein